MRKLSRISDARFSEKYQNHSLSEFYSNIFIQIAQISIERVNGGFTNTKVLKISFPVENMTIIVFML